MSSGFLRVRRKQYWRSSSVQTGDWHWHVAIKQCWELKQRAWPLQPGRTQWSNWTKAAPEMYAGQQWTRGQKQSIRCLGKKAHTGLIPVSLVPAVVNSVATGTSHKPASSF